MWEKGVTWLLGFLAIAVSAGWLAGRRTRSLRRLKSEVDLLVGLPVGTARTALEEHISASVRAYLQEREAYDRAWVKRVVAGVAQLVGLALLLLAEFNDAGLVDDWDKAPAWAMWLGSAGLALLFGSVMWEASHFLREMRRTQEALTGSHDERPADEELARGA